MASKTRRARPPRGAAHCTSEHDFSSSSCRKRIRAPWPWSWEQWLMRWIIRCS